MHRTVLAFDRSSTPQYKLLELCERFFLSDLLFEHKKG